MKKNIIKLLVSFVIIVLVVINIDINFTQALSNLIKPNYLYLSLLVPLFLIPIIGINRWQVFLKVQGIKEKFFVLLKINFTSIFLGILLPSSTGYDAIRMYQIEKRNKHNKGAGSSSVVIERLIGLIILSFLAIIGSVISIYFGAKLTILILPTILFIVIIAILFLLRNYKRFDNVSRLMSRFRMGRKITEFINSILISLNNFPLKRVIVPSVLLIMLFQFSTILCGFLIFEAFNINISFYYHIAFLPVIQIIAILPVSISGFGIRESGFVYFYGLVGVDPNISFLVSLLFYAVLMLVPAFIGFIIYTFSSGTNLKKDIIRKARTNE
jgi:uncharacterized protein (TIRG00374 family)